MRERAAVYDGVVEAGPLDGGGWRVRTRLTSAASGAGGARVSRTSIVLVDDQELLRMGFRLRPRRPARSRAGG